VGPEQASAVGWAPSSTRASRSVNQSVDPPGLCWGSQCHPGGRPSALRRCRAAQRRRARSCWWSCVPAAGPAGASGPTPARCAGAERRSCAARAAAGGAVFQPLGPAGAPGPTRVGGPARCPLGLSGPAARARAAAGEAVPAALGPPRRAGRPGHLADARARGADL